MKNILFINLIVLLIFTACREGEAKNSVVKIDVPYKATTVDECIHEKECVWYAFSEFIIKPGETIETSLIKKWNVPLKIGTLGAETKEIRYKLEKLSKIFSEPTALDITIIPEGFNIIIVVSDDFKKDTFERYDSFFKIYYKNVIFDYFNNNPTFPNATKLTLPYYDSAKNYVTSVMYVRKNIDVNEDLPMYFYSLFGLPGFVHMPAIEDYTYSKIDGLKLFLLEILYHKDIKAGMTLSEVRKNFDNIYLNSLKSYNKNNQ